MKTKKATQKKKPSATPATPPPPIRLDLGCGRNKQEGFTGVDLYAPDVDVRLDLTKFPWPWKDGSVDEIYCAHFVEHIPQELRWPFFEECWRILKPEATMKVFVPNWKSERAYGDMTHAWPPVSNFFFFYLNAAWRENNRLTYGPYALKCHFEHQAGPLGLMGDWPSKAHEVQLFAASHYTDSFADLWCVLTKKEMPAAPK